MQAYPADEASRKHAQEEDSVQGAVEGEVNKQSLVSNGGVAAILQGSGHANDWALAQQSVFGRPAKLNKLNLGGGNTSAPPQSRSGNSNLLLTPISISMNGTEAKTSAVATSEVAVSIVTKPAKLNEADLCTYPLCVGGTEIPCEYQNNSLAGMGRESQQLTARVVTAQHHNNTNEKGKVDGSAWSSAPPAFPRMVPVMTSGVGVGAQPQPQTAALAVPRAERSIRQHTAVTMTESSQSTPPPSLRHSHESGGFDITSVGSSTTLATQHRVSHNFQEPPESFLEVPTRRIVWRRLRVLVSLLILQSLSQVVLQAFEDLITTNVVVPLFLTMLVGAGGNAGNQASVTAITGLTSGELTRWDALKVIKKETVVGLLCASALGVIGFVRVLVFYINEEDTPAPVFTTVFAISLSLFIIVFCSVVLGAALPFALRRVGANVEHAAPTIQVVMDILGVTVCCVVCSAFLPTQPQSSVMGGVAIGSSGASAAKDSLAKGASPSTVSKHQKNSDIPRERSSLREGEGVANIDEKAKKLGLGGKLRADKAASQGAWGSSTLRNRKGKREASPALDEDGVDPPEVLLGND